MAKVNTHGGKRSGSGRKKSDTTKETVVIRVDASLVPIVKTLKDQLREGKPLDTLIGVTSNQDELDQLKARNMELLLHRDKEHLKARSLQSKVNSIQADCRALQRDYEALTVKEHSCQALTKDGLRCSKPARAKVKWHGVELRVCLQHQNSLT